MIPRLNRIRLTRAYAVSAGCSFAFWMYAAGTAVGKPTQKPG
jgi:hypothetical protein